MENFLQLEADINSNGQRCINTGRMYSFVTQGITDVNVSKSLIVAFSNVMLCCFSEIIAKEGITILKLMPIMEQYQLLILYILCLLVIDLKEFELYLLLKSFYPIANFINLLVLLKSLKLLL